MTLVLTLRRCNADLPPPPEGRWRTKLKLASAATTSDPTAALYLASTSTLDLVATNFAIPATRTTYTEIRFYGDQIQAVQGK